MEDFYKSTGIQPYLCLVSYDSVKDTDAARDEYIESKYTELFSTSKGIDEGHMLFCYFACQNDKPDVMDGNWLYIVGKQTETVMDENAKQILSHISENIMTIHRLMSMNFLRIHSLTPVKLS